MPDIKLSPLQKDVLSFFGKDFFGKNFYWTGGTLLSYLYFHHRLSVDLDFFSDDLYGDEQYLEFVNRLKKEVGAQKIVLTLQHNRRLYILERNNESIKLELVFFPFAAAGKRQTLTEFSFTADSLTDIMVNKILSAYQRQEPKDVFDIYCYLSNNPEYDLSQLIGLVEKKFGVAIEPVLLLAKINELADSLGKIRPLLIIPRPKLTNQVKDFFQKIFNLLTKKKIK